MTKPELQETPLDLEEDQTEVEETAKEKVEVKANLAYLKELEENKLKLNEKNVEIANLKREIENRKELEETAKLKLKENDVVIANLERKLEETKNEMKETLEEFGSILVENDKKVKDKRKQTIFEEIFVNISSTSSEAAQLPQLAEEASASAAAIQTLEVEAPSNAEIRPAVDIVQEIRSNDVVEPLLQESTEELSNRMVVSLAYVPRTIVERSVYNNYQLLVLTISGMLRSSEVEKFKEWARDVFHLELSTHGYEGFLELDRKGYISPSDLTNLRKFFEKLQRFDLVHLIDCFLNGDYTNLQRNVSLTKNNNPRRSSGTAALVAPLAIANSKPSLAPMTHCTNCGFCRFYYTPSLHESICCPICGEHLTK